MTENVMSTPKIFSINLTNSKLAFKFSKFLSGSLEDEMGKKRKLDSVAKEPSEVDTSKPTAIFTPNGGRTQSLSVALPGSIIANAQSREAQALLAGQVARALAVFCVDEVVIFDDGQSKPPPSYDNGRNGANKAHNGDIDHHRYTGFTDPNYFLAHVLSYLECPPYLRRALFERHPDLQHAGMFPSLDMPHHSGVRPNCAYREGVTRKDNGAEGQDRTIVDVGLNDPVYVAGAVPSDSRVTIKMGPSAGAGNVCEVVAPSAPREEEGWYWGYSVRTADSLSAVLTESPFQDGYDVTFGTSERGRPVSEIRTVPPWQHIIIVIGGVAGLEAAMKADKELEKLAVDKPESLFEHWVNLVPNQGSRTIRTEEAVWLGLMALRGISQVDGAY